jgi:hypothetical protein
MIPTTRVGLLAGVLALTGVSVAAGPTNETDARIAELEAQVARLTSEQNGDWLTDQRAEEIRGLVQDVLADADTRASLLQSGMTAGYDDGFMIGSSDGAFTLKLNGQLQVRHVTNYQDQGNTDTDENRRGFENTRTKLMFSGNVGGPDWTYHIEGDFARNGGSFSLDQGWINWNFTDGWSVSAGQFKAPTGREWIVHSSNQLAVERSNLSYTHFASYTQGFWFTYTADAFKIIGSYNDGAFAAGSPWSVEDTEYAFTFRGEYLFSGTWDQFEDMTSPQGSEQGMMLGGSFHYQRAEYGSATRDELAALLLSADFSIEGDGWNAMAAIHYANFDDDNGVDDDWIGFLVQGGFYITEDMEIFVRWEWNDYDDFAGPGIGAADTSELNIITAGLTRYMTDNMKWTSDISFGLDTVVAPFDVTGYRPDVTDEDGQFVLRSQWQLVF